MKQGLSLKGRAIALLAQREQSAIELRRKLTRHARAEAVAAAADNPESVAARVDAVIEWLRQHDYLNESRFIESRVNARASRFGSLRIERELSQHGLSLGRDDALALRSSEPVRAAEVWQRKFGRAPVDQAEQGKQIRFLMARGFAPSVVYALVRSTGRCGPPESDDEPAPD